MSMSEPKPECAKFVQLNHKHGPTHWFEDMGKQMAGSACQLHPTALCCDPSPEDADLAIAGTPCHPYSTQRAGRFAAASVSEHPEFGVAMEDFMQWLLRFEPKAVIFEQVQGFRMPMVAGGQETPMDLLLAFIKYSAVLSRSVSSTSH